jgi:hypothetical protein
MLMAMMMMMISRVNLKRIKKKSSPTSVIIAGKSLKMVLSLEDIHLKSILENLFNMKIKLGFKIKITSINFEDNTFKKLDNQNTKNG